MSDKYERDVAAAAPRMPIATGQWVVWRHAGRKDSTWHPVYPQYAFEDEGRAAYQKALDEGGRGAVRLTGPDGKIVAQKAKHG